MKAEVKVMVTKDNRILQFAKLYYEQYRDNGTEMANGWLALNVPEQIHHQVRRLALAYFKLQQKRKET